VIRPGGIGDTILAFPAIEHLKTGYTEVWVRGDVVPLVRFADRVRSIASTGLDLLELPDSDPPPDLLQSLRAFDSIVSWYGSNRIEFRERVTALGLPARFLSALPDPNTRMHASDFFLQQAGGTETAIPRIRCDVERSNFAVIHPFSGSGRKNWPIDRFHDLAARMPIPVRWCAGREESLDGAMRLENLWDLARWLARARLYIGNDSGITHLAAAVGTPVVAIFGPSDLQIWAPRGERVRIVSGELANISVNQVCHLVRELLSTGLPSKEDL
jgi:ADP-heptose:LPS heptosyltransferase